MSKSLKVILITVSGFITFLVLVVAALYVFLDVNDYKSWIERVASKTLGMEVKVAGRLELGFFPGLQVTGEDVQIHNRGSDVVSAKRAGFGIDLLPLLQKEIRIREIALIHPTISIERDRDGTFNFEKTEQAERTFLALKLSKVSFTDGTFRYADKQAPGEFEAVGCNLDARNLQFSGEKSPDFLKHLSCTANLACEEIRTRDFSASDLKLDLVEQDGVIDVKPVTIYVFGAQGSGSIQADFTGDVPRYHVQSSLQRFQVKEFLEILSPTRSAEGEMDFSANLSMQGQTINAIKKSATGDVSLRSENLTLDGLDIDRKLSRFESSQNFNLVDVGTFFFVGPFGLAVTKGYNFAGIFQESGSSSIVRTLISDWKVEHGVAQARDVAMATNQNRIALKGKLDFVNERFDDVTLAAIDTKGCATMVQKINGPFQKPVVEEPSILKSLFGPALQLFEKGRELVLGEECEVFYSGSVLPPE